MSDEANALKDVIKSRGYWEVDIRPDEPIRDRFDSIQDCMNKVEESSVLIRGWDYPHFGNKPRPYSMNRRIESYVDFGSNKEYWTMFLNGHFYHLFSCREDWLGDRGGVLGRSRYDDTEPGTTLGFIMTLYSITEIFEFTSRLAQKNILGKKVRIQLTLHHMQDRKLTSFVPGRFMRGELLCREHTIPFDIRLSTDELIGNGRNVAVDTTIQVYEIFQWLNISRDIIVEAQSDFYEKRF